MRVYRIVGLDNRTLTYDEFFGLWLNVEGAIQSGNFHSAVAGSVASGRSKMPREWIEAAVQGTSGVQEWRNWDTMRLLSGG